MSQLIQIEAIPNQSFDVTLEGQRYTIRLTTCYDFMAVDIYRNGLPVVIGSRVVNGGLMIPAKYQFFMAGNFAIISNDYEIPMYQRFGVSQFLMYFTALEMDQINS